MTSLEYSVNCDLKLEVASVGHDERGKVWDSFPAERGSELAMLSASSDSGPPKATPSASTVCGEIPGKEGRSGLGMKNQEEVH